MEYLFIPHVSLVGGLYLPLLQMKSRVGYKIRIKKICESRSIDLKKRM